MTLRVKRMTKKEFEQVAERQWIPVVLAGEGKPHWMKGIIVPPIYVYVPDGGGNELLGGSLLPLEMISESDKNSILNIFLKDNLKLFVHFYLIFFSAKLYYD